MDGGGRVELAHGSAGRTPEIHRAEGAGQERPERSAPQIQRVHAQQRPQLQGRPQREG